MTGAPWTEKRVVVVVASVVEVVGNVDCAGRLSGGKASPEHEMIARASNGTIVKVLRSIGLFMEMRDNVRLDAQ